MSHHSTSTERSPSPPLHAWERWLGAVAHDLRTPLHAITCLLQHGSASQPFSEQQRVQLHHTTILMLTTLDAAVTLGQRNLGAPAVVTAHDVLTWWEPLAAMARTLRPHLALHLKQPEAPAWPNNPPWRTHHAALHVLLLNLWQNALHATTSGSLVLEVAPQADSCCLTLHDTGLGMSPATRAAWEQAPDTTDPDALPNALGHALVHQQLQQLRGTLQVESSLGQGTTITLTLPSLSGAE